VTGENLFNNSFVSKNDFSYFLRVFFLFDNLDTVVVIRVMIINPDEVAVEIIMTTMGE